MKRKGSLRFVHKRIEHVFKLNNNVGMRFAETFKALARNGWLHTQRPIIDNLRFLIKEGKFVHIEGYYAPIQIRDDGTKFCVIKDPVEKVIELE